MRLWLVKSNVPYDIAFGLNEDLLWAHWITLAEFERPPEENWNFTLWDWNKKLK